VNACFVTGTDTGVGKTVASVALLDALAAAGRRAVGMKPVASGCRPTETGWRNEDAEALLAASVPVPAYADVNPYAFADPIAPHVAAADAGVRITLDPLRSAFGRLAAQADVVVVEGVGGWMAPLADDLMQADLARALGLPVVLVVGLRLGAINHALLTARAILADGCVLAGWIANRIDPQMARAEATLDCLRARLPAPLLGVLDHAQDGRPRPSLDLGLLR
jgi:dethiobiotin synthetase